MIIMSNQKSAEESIAALEEQMQTVAVKYVDIEKSLNEKVDSLQTSMDGILQKEKEHEELKARLQELRLKTEEENAQDLISEIADMKKMIMSNQKSAEERIAALEEQRQVKNVDIRKSLNEIIDSFQTIQDNIDTKLINISTKFETLERTLTEKLERKEDRKLTILVLGGKGSNKMHLLNRDRKQWSTLLLQLPTTLNSGGAIHLDGEIYIFGGWYSVKKLYKLNRRMKWIQLADMIDQRGEITNSYLVFDGCIWVFGGWNYSEGQLNSVEKYIPEENKWIQMPSMNEKRRLAAAVACKGKLFVSGGYDDADNGLRSMECFDPVSQKWTMFLDLPSPTWGHAMISDGICLTVLGGLGDGKSVWEINPNEEKATWKKVPPMRESRWNFSANFLGDNIFAIGGVGRRKKVEIFNGETWEYGPELPEGIENMCSIVIPAHLDAAELSIRQNGFWFWTS